MKKIVSLVLMFVMTVSCVNISAETLYEEFSIDDITALSKPTDEMQLLGEDAQAELEKRLVAGWSTLADEIDVSDLGISSNSISAMYSKVLFKNPYYYYVKGSFSGTKFKNNQIKTIKPNYTETDINSVKKTWAQIDKAVEEILLYVKPGMTEYEKVMAVHDYMAYNYVYDIDDDEQNMLIVIDKRGVCAAYSYAFIHVMNLLGIDSYFITSEDMVHAWNIVNIDGEWYHIDVTWDNVSNNFAYGTRKYALLSTSAVIENGHYDFDTGDYVCDSTLYDDFSYLSAYCDGKSYFIKGKNVVDEDDNVIFENLDGGDGWWHITSTSGFPNTIYSGICELNGILYFNTDNGIYSYNPKTKATELVLEKRGICGMFADENVLRYNEYNMQTGTFTEAGSIKIADIKLTEPYYEDGKVVVKLYNDCDEPVWVICRGDTYRIEKITEEGVNTVTFENGDEQTVFIWKESLEPIVEGMNVE